MLATEAVIGGRYHLGPVIGRGGGADVYRADDLETGRPVAVKVLRAVAPDDLRRFEAEARTLTRLDHPAIVRLCGQGEQDGVPYLVLDLIDGPPLSTLLMRGPMEEDAVIAMGAALAGALAQAHALGIVHRDVKPGNVLFDDAGRAHLTDFGIARLTDATSVTATGFVLGTAAYLSPEQVTGEEVGPPSDVYSLGLLLIEALTGTRAFAGSPTESALARLHRQPDVPGTRARWLGPMLASMTAADPHLRPSAAVVADTFVVQTVPGDATTVLPVATDATSAVPVMAAAGRPLTTDGAQAPPVAPDRRRLWVALAVTAAVLLVALLSLFAGGTGLNAPATASTQTTPSTVSPATQITAATTVPTTTPPAPAPKEKGKPKGRHGGD